MKGKNSEDKADRDTLTYVYRAAYPQRIYAETNCQRLTLMLETVNKESASDRARIKEGCVRQLGYYHNFFSDCARFGDSARVRVFHFMLPSSMKLYW